jgi:ribosome-interacting GTPase 1
MSCELDLGVQDVVERIWTELRLIRVYTKRYFQPHSLLQNSTRVTDIIQERRRPRLLGGADRAQQLDHRGCL